MNEIEEVIKQQAPTRADGVPVPSRAPDGWTHLSVAMAKLAAELLDGPSRDWRDAYPHIVTACNRAANGDGGEPDSGGGDQLTTFLTDIFSREAVLTGYRPVGGGSPVVTMPGDWWDVDDPSLRFRTWSIDPNDILSADTKLPCWLWVDSIGLETVLEKVSAAKAGVSRFHVYSEREWMPFGEAIQLLREATPPIGDPLVHLISLLAPCAVEARATDAQKWFRGVMVMRQNWHAVTPKLWENAGPDPRNDPAEGLFFISDGDAVHVLSGVMVGRESLVACLRRNGFQLPEAPTGAAQEAKPVPPESTDGAIWEDDPSRPGPKKWKEYPMLEAVFKANHARLADCDSDRARMQELTRIWRGLDKRKTGRDTCPSKAVVKRCWERYVTTRH